MKHIGNKRERHVSIAGTRPFPGFVKNLILLLQQSLMQYVAGQFLHSGRCETFIPYYSRASLGSEFNGY